MREIILDIESTGLFFDKGDRIIEIGCVELKNKTLTNNHFQVYINPNKIMDAEVQAVHGITQDFLNKQPVFQDIVQDFLDFVQNDTLVIHNANFDFPFINHELKLCGLQPMTNPVIDTLKEYRKKFPGSPASLNAFCKRFNIDLKEREKHGALIDAKLLALAYIELCGGLQTTFFTLESHEQEQQKALQAAQQCEALSKSDANIMTMSNFQKRNAVAPSSEELEAHIQYISSIKNNIWNN